MCCLGWWGFPQNAGVKIWLNPKLGDTTISDLHFSVNLEHDDKPLDFEGTRNAGG
jgi:hypothetical protein